jgi:hypothetical protein
VAAGCRPSRLWVVPLPATLEALYPTVVFGSWSRPNKFNPVWPSWRPFCSAPCRLLLKTSPPPPMPSSCRCDHRLRANASARTATSRLWPGLAYHRRHHRHRYHRPAINVNLTRHVGPAPSPVPRLSGLTLPKVDLYFLSPPVPSLFPSYRPPSCYRGIKTELGNIWKTNKQAGVSSPRRTESGSPVGEEAGRPRRFEWSRSIFFSSSSTERLLDPVARLLAEASDTIAGHGMAANARRSLNGCRCNRPSI